MQIRTEAYLSRGRAGAVAALAVFAALGLPLLHFSPGSITSQLSAPRLGLSGANSAPIHFEPNQGQASAQVRYVAHTSQGTLLFAPAGVSMLLRDTGTDDPTTQQPEGQKAVSFSFLDAHQAALGTDQKTLALANYVIGNDATRWHIGIPTYGAVIYDGLYDGVTLRYEGTEGRLKGTYTIRVGSNPGRIRWQYTGATSLSVDRSGDLLIGLPAGSSDSLRELAPVAWQEIGGKRVPVQAKYSISKDRTVGFALGDYNPTYALTIDPAITYSTYVGGTSTEAAYAVAADAAGNTYVAGQTSSTDFPVQGAYQGTSAGGGDAFVSKFNPDGTLAFSTYFGGSGSDEAYGIKADAGGIYVAGRTLSANFPTHNAYHATGAGNWDAFLTRLSTDGQTLLYSTYFGGSGTDQAWGVAVDGSGNAYIGGNTNSTNLPARNAYQSALGGAMDGFVARINTDATGDASLVYSTYFGGTADEYIGGRGVSAVGHGIAADATGHAYVSGETFSSNLPTLNAFQTANGGNLDAFSAKFDTNGSGSNSLLYSTYLGGNGADQGRDVAVDGSGNAYIVGVKGSTNFPSRSAYATCGSSNQQPFVAKLNMSAAGDSSLVYATCFGNTATGYASGIAVDGAGSAVIAGNSAQNTWPLLNAIMGWTAGQDAFVTRLNAAGNALVYSTYLGGSGNDYSYDVALDGNGSAYVVGSTDSTNFPTHNAFQATNHGQFDTFVTKIDESLPAPSPTPTASPVPQCTANFSDVHPSDYFYTSVTYLYCHGAISGYSDGTFRPYNNTTRGQLSKIVVLSEGWSIDTTGGPHFADVPPTDAFYAYIETAFNHGIISGYSDGTFRPGNSVTRGQLCKIIVAAEGWPIDTTGGPHFSDVPTNNAFYTYIETAFNKGIISGYSDGTFKWGNTATRGQICKIVYGAITSPR